MDIGNIKNRRLPALEQACQRYAIMAFEQLNERLAVGLGSIKYSFKAINHAGSRGSFIAEFTPKVVCDCPKKQDRSMTVEWGIVPNGHGRWKLYGGFVSVQGEPGLHTVAWSEDGSKMEFFLNAEEVDLDGFKGSVLV